MISIDEMEIMLDEVALEIPSELYEKLNGGVLLLPDTKVHPQSVGSDLYILGEYHRDNTLGRYIAIYYGSFCRVYGFLTNENMKMELMKTLKHEFRHHIESLAGDKSLERIDEDNIVGYLKHKT